MFVGSSENLGTTRPSIYTDRAEQCACCPGGDADNDVDEEEEVVVPRKDDYEDREPLSGSTNNYSVVIPQRGAVNRVCERTKARPSSIQAG